MVQTKERIGYIDAMRGLAMFMVVIYHVSLGCFNSHNIITEVINVQLELPLFFFISGFFMGHIRENGYKKAFINKFYHLVIPALIMMSLFCWVKGISPIDGIQYRLKSGYWFTLVLFGFNVIYILTDFLSKKLGEAIYQKNIYYIY